jgi:signal transduction histidine kinase
LIIGEIELAQMNVKEDKRMSGYLESIDSASSRMLRLIQVFKDIDSVNEKNVRNLIQHLVEETRKSYPHVSISSHIKPTEESVVIKGKSLIPFVFDNLIRNAVQHVGPNVEVNIYMSAEDENVVIDFVDNGPGISKELSETLFQKSESKTRGGFGLYLCKKIIEIYSGSISLLSNDVYNKGTAFRIELPRIKEVTLPKGHTGY